MKIVLCLAALTALYCCVNSNYISPKVQVYSRMKGQYGGENTLICNVKDFHPPDISIELLKDGEVLPYVRQTDLAFKPTWQFHLTYYVPFTPVAEHKYSCRVTHGSIEKNYAWEPNM